MQNKTHSSAKTLFLQLSWLGFGQHCISSASTGSDENDLAKKGCDS